MRVVYLQCRKAIHIPRSAWYSTLRTRRLYRIVPSNTCLPQWGLHSGLVNGLHTVSKSEDHVPLRKFLKEEARKRRIAQDAENVNDNSVTKDEQAARSSRLKRWRLTVGLEIHAQLNTDRKLFSEAQTALSDVPNSNIALFDLAIPGCQPQFQQATVIPALRAAIGLSCRIQPKSTFDRKHYYYQDQPAGYQITQYYKPFATEGHLTVYDYDGIAPEDGESVEIGIKQVQMEQDTAKSTLQPPSTALLDFNRVGHPLIEIITLPDIHHPQTAAACVRKIQAILQAVNAVTTGMEMGGLRADVNVSVSRTGSDLLGQRTEIKNLSSFKAVEDAIVAERDRQIEALESGGIIHGETRGWTLGSTETRKLRGKEGEVDYRYMPDPDIPPLIIGGDLVTHVHESLPELPEHSIKDLVDNSGLSIKDAKTLVTLDDGERLEYFDQIRVICRENSVGSPNQSHSFDKIITNWVLHELGGLLNASNIPFSQDLVSAEAMAHILSNLYKGQITGTIAKRLLSTVFNGDERPIDTIIEQEDLRLQPLSRDEYLAMAKELIAENKTKVKQIQQKKQLGKLQFFVGQMMRRGEGKVEAGKAESILKELLGLD